MTVLLDTCAFLWMSTDETLLSATARSVIADPFTRRLLSSISVLEIVIKTRLGKLNLKEPLDVLLQEGINRGAIEELPVTIIHSLAVARLPLLHRDPFDRLLIAQALVEGIPLVTNDRAVSQYGINVIW